MYIFNDSYAALVSFIMGYTDSVCDFLEVNIDGQFQEWLRKKYKRHFALHWSGYILVELSKNDEKIACSSLLSLWEEFVNSYEE